MKAQHKRRLVQGGIIVGVWTGITVVATLHDYLMSLFEEGWTASIVGLLRWQIPQWVPWAVLTPIVFWLGRRIPLGRGRWPSSIAFHFGVATAVVLVHTAMLAVLTITLVPNAQDESFGQFYLQMVGLRFLSSLFVYGGILGAGLAIDYYRKYREHELAASQLETQLAQAHLQALKMQFHPHFLFNTLHAVSVLIKESPEDAAKMVTRLGDFLRLAIDTVGTQEVSLREELEFLELYLAIEQTRFHDRLTVAFDIEPTTWSARVPSFILQPLVENSIKHGIREHAGEGNINVISKRENGRLVLSVEDGGNGRDVTPTDTWKDGVGLRTTRERLARMYGDDHLVSIQAVDKGVRVSLTIPYRLDPAAADA